MDSLEILDNPDALEAELARLPKMSKDDLLELWQAYFRGPPPAVKVTMVQELAYRMQELAYGGLEPRVIAQLLAIAKGKAQSRRADVTRPVIGTQLLREYNGQTYAVTVVASGYEYDGRVYNSLSRIARVITGTTWNGNVFFGLIPAGGKR